MKTLAIIAYIFLLIGVNLLFFKYEKIKTELDMCEAFANFTTVPPVEIYVHDKLTSCEEKGGKYSLIYSDLRNDYVQSCDVPKTEITDF